MAQVLRRSLELKVRQAMARITRGVRLGEARFMTLTSTGDEDGPSSYRQLPQRWKRLQLRLERTFGPIEYIGVVEMQRRGAAHFHLLYRGPYVPQRWLARNAAECGFGPIADIRRPKGQVARYLTKYLTKELHDPTKAPPRYFRRLRYSSGWCAWERPRRLSRWATWWYVDAVPLAAAVSAGRRGYDVVELVTSDWTARIEPRRAPRWLRTLDRFRPNAPWPANTAVA